MVNLIAQNIEMCFDERQLFTIDRVQLSEGKTIHLQGDNGSGKTTLMKLLAGLLKPSSGTITAEGFAPLPWWRSNPLLGKAVYLHQHPYLFDGSVEYNLRYPHPFSDLSTNELNQRTQIAIEMAQLTHLHKQAASSLSGGERQRLAIARAWVMRPKLLMLDEPTSNMDKYSQQLVLAMINELQEFGTGMLISSHQSCALTSLCNQTWIIKDRTIVSSSAAINPAKTAPINIQDSQYVIAN
ncbi:ABC-type cobalt transport system, ATPase component [Shewanella psychrophila]|uniref:ABC-type cobalt transport system, ATPase component n=1 Tax=Shewanella psychrophila TaxID=225848 RepID=A0A1S6HIQ2_9GAMM|nr:energy-coupling factor ABC transporter ATP-binding protein [Shewanella psychrophila]AQS35389.1 ABC-type cobalt transport system, ATPase component [Shewanella psychrophila]